MVIISIGLVAIALSPPVSAVEIGYGVWANSTTESQAIQWGGSENVVNGNVHSNNDFKMSGSHNVINGTLEYVSTFTISGSDNTYLNALQVSPEPFPARYNLEDYKPGGTEAIAAGSNYHNISGNFHIPGSEVVLDGLYYVKGDVKLSGSNISGVFTIVAEGDIHVSGSGYNCRALSGGLLFLSNGTRFKIAGSQNRLAGIIYVPKGEIGISGSRNTINGCLLGDTVKLSGSEIRIETDSGGDGISDLQEVMLGTDPELWTNTDGIVYTEASTSQEVINLTDTAQVKLRVVSNTTMVHSPVDVVLVTDRSGSMRQSGWTLVKEGEPAYTFNGVNVPNRGWSAVNSFTVDSDVDKLAAQVTWDRVPGFEGSEASEVVINLRRPDRRWIFNGGFTLLSSPRAGGKVDPPDSVGRSNEYYSGICTKPQTLLVENPQAGTWEVAVYGWNLRPKTNPPASIDVNISVYVDHADNSDDDLDKTDTSISIEAAKEAAKSFITNMNGTDRAGYVKFGSRGVLAQGLTVMDDAGKSNINTAIDNTGLGGGTAINTGIDEAKDELVNNGRDGVPKVIVLLTDGQNDYGSARVLESAQAAKDANITIFTIGLTAFVNEEMLKEVATKPDYYYYSPDGAQLQDIYNEISERVQGLASDVRVKYVLSDKVEYAGNASITPEIDNQTLEWGIGDLTPVEPWRVTFDVTPLDFGKQAVNVVPDSVVNYRHEPSPGSVPFPAVFVVVKTQPVADFVWTPAEPKADQNVTFTATASDPDGGSVLTYEWNFGDGSTDSGETVTHAFDEKGNYTVTLTVTDDEGETVSVNSTVNVLPTPPVADFGVTQAEPYYAGQELTFDASASYDEFGYIVSYKWNFGDGYTADVTNETIMITHAFDKGGNYTVTLTVKDDEGEEATVSHAIKVTKLVAVIGVSSEEVETYESVTLDGTGSYGYPEGETASYNWTISPANFDILEGTLNSSNLKVWFRDGTNDGKSYSITLTVTDNYGVSNSTTVEVKVKNRAPDASIIGPSIISEGVNVEFSANASDRDGVIVSYGWDFGDGYTENGEKVEHVYSVPEEMEEIIYTVNLTVVDDDSATATATHEITVKKNIPPVAIIKASNSSGTFTDNLTVLQYEYVIFSGTQSYDPDGYIASFNWDFGDENTSSLAGYSHKYSANGTYTVNVTITDNYGKSSECSIIVTVLPDTDGDGLTDSNETTIGTNLSNPDTDGDGFSDGEEIANNCNPRDSESKPEPAVNDTDGDGLTDSNETTIGTNLSNPDTDGDGFSDGEEVSRGSNPMNSESTPKNSAFSIKNVSISKQQPYIGELQNITVTTTKNENFSYEVLIGDIVIGEKEANTEENSFYYIPMSSGKYNVTIKVKHYDALSEYEGAKEQLFEVRIKRVE